MVVYHTERQPVCHPRNWKMRKFADIDGSEQFVKDMLELRTLVDAGIIYEPLRTQVKDAIMTILNDGLMPARMELEEIRKVKAGVRQIPIMDTYQLFEDLARKLWKSYKSLFQDAAVLAGFEIGFLFDNFKEFDKGIKTLYGAHPRLRPGIDNFLVAVRDDWQNGLSRFRNTWVEHQRGDRKQFKEYYMPEGAEYLFDAVWRTIVEIFALLLETKLWPGWTLVEQRRDDPEPKWGQRWRYHNPDFTAKVGGEP